ncbi:Isochorismatase-like protein [Lyophyllum atratum]|nr:Isochorismatase-like protein [Lyophyllum atratum]
MVDLHHEFLLPEGRFRIHNDTLPFLEILPDITTAFRASGYPLFCIRSEYGNTGASIAESADFIGKPRRGVSPGVRALIDGLTTPGGGENIILPKTWYSASKEPVLLAQLEQREITDIFVCGLLTNVCVYATVLDTRAHELEVTLAEDYLGWRKRASRDRAIRAMVTLGARLSFTEEICPNGPESPTFDSTTGNKLPELHYVNGAIPSWRVVMALHKKLIYDALEDAHLDPEHVGGKLDAVEQTRLITAVDCGLDYWEAYTGSTAFIDGEEFGLADCAFFPILAYMVHRGFEWQRRGGTEGILEDAWPQLRAYYHRVWEHVRKGEICAKVPTRRVK